MTQRPIGHARAVETLEAYLPQVTLLLGPKSIGKSTIADWIVDQHGVHELDVRRFEGIKVEAAREIVVAANQRPAGPFRVLILNLDGATLEGLNVLLKTLEEPPETLRFVLLASEPPPLTIASRAAVFALGYLSTSEVESVLKRLGKDIKEARLGALLSGGQISRALAAEDLDFLRSPVTTLLTAVARRDTELFWTAFMKLRSEAGDISTDVAHLLRLWCIEARTGRWRCFDPEDAHGLHFDRAAVNRIEHLLAMNSRPLIAIKAALLTAIEERTAVRF